MIIQNFNELLYTFIKYIPTNRIQPYCILYIFIIMVYYILSVPTTEKQIVSFFNNNICEYYSRITFSRIAQPFRTNEHMERVVRTI